MSEITPVCSATNLQLQLTLRPSLWYCLYIVLFHGLAITSVWLVALSWPIQWLATFLLLVLASWQCFRYWRTYPRSLLWLGNGWLLDGCRIQLLADYSWHPHFLHLRFQFLEGVQEGRKRAWVIWPLNVCAGSAVDRAESLRRLRFLLLNTAAVFHSGKPEEASARRLMP